MLLALSDADAEKRRRLTVHKVKTHRRVGVTVFKLPQKLHN